MIVAGPELPWPAVNGSVLPVGRAASRRPRRGWRLRPWPNDPSSLLLVFVDHSSVPTPDDLEEATEHARRLGAARLRTSALFPRATEVAEDAGFFVIDRLALLRLDLHAARHTITPEVRRRHGRTRPLRRWHVERAAAVDQRAFGLVWGNDAASLADVRTATPVHRARYVGKRGSVVGFAISGAGGDSGYIQRVAVDPDVQRSGIGRRLVVDSLAWMIDRRLTTAHVNTGVDNTAALALYQSLGFVELDERLTIAERDLT